MFELEFENLGALKKGTLAFKEFTLVYGESHVGDDTLTKTLHALLNNWYDCLDIPELDFTQLKPQDSIDIDLAPLYARLPEQLQAMMEAFCENLSAYIPTPISPLLKAIQRFRKAKLRLHLEQIPVLETPYRAFAPSGIPKKYQMSYVIEEGSNTLNITTDIESEPEFRYQYAVECVVKIILLGSVFPLPRTFRSNGQDHVWDVEIEGQESTTLQYWIDLVLSEESSPEELYFIEGAELHKDADAQRALVRQLVQLIERGMTVYLSTSSPIIEAEVKSVIAQNADFASLATIHHVHAR